MSQRIWIISDTHFFHSNIIRYTGRPFETTKEMNDKLIKNWNKVVKQTDIVYHLGDFAFAGKEAISQILSTLNGRKILVKGNHDSGSAKRWIEFGFELVYEHPVILDEYYILSHEPVFLSPDAPYANIHGHIHELKMEDPRFFNASVERIDYTPIEFEKIKKILAENS